MFLVFKMSTQLTNLGKDKTVLNPCINSSDLLVLLVHENYPHLF